MNDNVVSINAFHFIPATAIGILPASFLLAHFGAESMEQSMTINLVIVVCLLIGTGIWQYISVKKKALN